MRSACRIGFDAYAEPRTDSVMEPQTGTYDDVTDDSALSYGDEAVRAGDAATRVAQVVAPKKKKSKRPPAHKKNAAWKAVADGPHASTSRIYLLFYLPLTEDDSYTINNYLAYLHGSTDQSKWPTDSPFMSAGIEIIVRSDPDTAWQDLGGALHESGAVVVFMGHSARSEGAKKAHSLRPRRDPDDGSADIKISELTPLLKTMNAKVLIVASCATDGCIGKVKRDTVVIATNSGGNFLSNTLAWSRALDKLLKAFVSGKTLAEGVVAANVQFKANSVGDSFVVASGETSMTWTK